MSQKLAQAIINLVHKVTDPSIVVTSHGGGLLISDVVSHYNKSLGITETGKIEVIDTETRQFKHYKLKHLHKAIADLHRINP